MLPAMVVPVAVACSECHDDSADGSARRFEIRGNVGAVTGTRSMAEGTVPDGDGYRITYPSAPDRYVTDTCVFTQGTGLVTNADGHFLTWSDIGHGQSYTFYLDNVVLDDDEALVRLSDDYVAGFDSPEANNDIVWGSLKLTDRTTVNLGFELYHRMSRMSVCVRSASGDELRNAAVALKGIVLRPESFNRMTGEVGVSDTPAYAYAVLREGSSEWLPLYRTTKLSAGKTARQAGVSVKGFYEYLQTWHKDLVCARKGIPYEEGEAVDRSSVRRYNPAAAAKYADAIARLKEGGLTMAKAAAEFGLHPDCFRQYLKEHEPELHAGLGMKKTENDKMEKYTTS